MSSQATTNENRETKPSDDGIWVLDAGIALFALFASNCYFWLVHPLRLGADQALLIEIAKMLSDGRQLYTQIHEINPPLIVYFNLLPAAIYDNFPISAAQALALVVQTLTLTSLCLSAYCAYKNRDDKQIHLLVSILIAFLIFMRTDIMFEFGQKEELFCITYLPFLFVRYQRWNNRTVGTIFAVTCGIFAGLGICLKHYFLLAAVAPELIYWIQKRKAKPLIAPEIVGVGTVGTVYLVHLLLLPRPVLQAYLGFILPIVQKGYAYYTVSPMMALNSWNPEFYQIGILLTLAIPLARRTGLFAPVAAFTMASTATYLVASQPWSYHLTPARFGLYLLAALEITSALSFLAKRLPVGWNRYNRVAATAIVPLIIIVFAINLLFTYLNTLNEQNTPVGILGNNEKQTLTPWQRLVYRYSQPGDYILFITRGVAPGYPVTLEMKRKNGSRYLHGMTLLMANYIVSQGPTVANADFYRAMLNRILVEYAEDIKHFAPTLIIIQKSEIDDVLKNNKFYVRAMREYQLAETFDDYLIFARRL